MGDLTPEEEKQILQSSPKGTLTLLVIFAIAATLGWLYMYFGMFLIHGPVN